MVNQVGSYGNLDNGSSKKIDPNNSSNASDLSGENLIQKRVASLSAHLVLVGDITEEKENKQRNKKNTRHICIIYPELLKQKGNTQNI